MITLSAGLTYDIITFLFIPLIILLLIIFRKKYIFKGLATINKVILPSLVGKDLSRLKIYEKLIFGYRYWVTKNSL